MFSHTIGHSCRPIHGHFCWEALYTGHSPEQMHIDLVYSFQNKMLLQQQYDIQRKQLKYALSVCHSLLKMELYDNKEILFLHLTYILFFFFFFFFFFFVFYIFISGTGNECRDFSSPPEIKGEKNARMIQSLMHSGGRNPWCMLFKETWHHFIDLMNIFLLKGNILFYSALFFFFFFFCLSRQHVES